MSREKKPADLVLILIEVKESLDSSITASDHLN